MLTALSSPSSMPSPLQSRPTAMAAPAPAPIDSDGDRDNDTQESASAKAAESPGGAPSLPTDPNRGRTLNITA
ncbi:hypothetical protein [Azospirillum sp. B510]|uniref:hypothetical protein n=1 Tax=Azospirillum sp. (strain B510) TaxID=137722 RepID=UPI0003097B1E|nr:hypothetical protein [Azospirillum sp. B510]